MSDRRIDVFYLADEERATMKANIERNTLCYAFATNAIALLDQGITGFSESRSVFGRYQSQLNVSLVLCLLSALRQHETQAYAMLRLATEHACLAAYAIQHPDDSLYSSDDPEHPTNYKSLLRNRVYAWIAKTLPEESEHFKSIKAEINKAHAHASIVQTRLTHEVVDPEGLRVKMHFTDRAEPLAVATNLFHIGHVALLSMMTLAKVAASDGHYLRFADNAKEEVLRVREYGLRAFEELRVHPGQ